MNNSERVRALATEPQAAQSPARCSTSTNPATASGTPSTATDGLYAQAREFYGPRRMEHDAPVRIAMRQGCMRECVGGGAFAELIIGTFFGFSLRVGRPLALVQPSTPRRFNGSLACYDLNART